MLEPFRVKLYASEADPNYNDVIVLEVTRDHLLHSFRTRESYEVTSLDLMMLKRHRHLTKRSPRGSVASMYSPVVQRNMARHPVYKLILGGVLAVPRDVDPPPGPVGRPQKIWPRSAVDPQQSTSGGEGDGALSLLRSRAAMSVW